MSSHFLLKLLQGVLIGLAAVLPGISGGVLSVVFGIYIPFMEFLSDPKTHFRTHFSLLFPYFLGYVLGFLGIARILSLFLSAYPEETICLFAGTILGSIPTLYRDAKSTIKKEAMFAGKVPSPLIIMLFSSVFMSILLLFIRCSTFSTKPNFSWYLFCGFCLSLSIIAPGMSFSALLMPLGLYAPFIDGLGHGRIFVILPSGIGAALTILFLSRLINKLFKQYPVYAKHGIIGIILSSTVLSIPYERLYTLWGQNRIEFLILLLYLGIGILLARCFDEDKRNVPEEKTGQKERP